jgi:hypothetical protein
MGYDAAVFHDAAGRFFSATSLENRQSILDLHGYVDGSLGFIPYFDVTVFHRSDADIAGAFVSSERTLRDG